MDYLEFQKACRLERNLRHRRYWACAICVAIAIIGAAAYYVPPAALLP